MLLANDIAGIRAVGVLRPGVGEVGASELVLQAQRKPFEGFALVNNRGSKFTGPERVAIMVQENAGTSLGERVEALFLSTFSNEQQYGQLSYEQPLGSRGLQMRVSGSIGPSEPGFNLDPLDVETETQRAVASLTYPVIRSRARNFYVGGGFEAIHSKVDILGDKQSRDDLRILYADASYDFKDQFGGQSLINVTIRQGLEILGASAKGDSDLSRAGGGSDATVVRGRVSRRQTLTEQSGLYLAATGQYASDKLLSVEEFELGGERFGRGYDPSEIRGDDSLGLTTEFQYTDTPRLNLLQAYQLYAFYDFGVVWIDSDSEDNDRESLASTGVGVRTQIWDQVFVDLEVAKPLTREPATRDDKDPLFFFQVLARY